MKIRVTGTKEECEALQEYFLKNLSSVTDYSVSRLYPNRNSNLFRIYVDVTLHSDSSLKKLKRGPQ